MKTMPCSGVGSQSRRKPGAGTTKPPSPGSVDDDRRDPVLADLGVDHVDRAGSRVGAGEAVAVRVGHRHPVDVTGERTEAVLVGRFFAVIAIVRFVRPW